ncbi:hypothetical protein Bhyg_13030 [Pseudolycoriella hygida]|uniref:Secreted protein n=1 Tax=Pseudolycoriella hygida TaxID=35572 RepID=A0A9Q0MZY2_9DIPT|nr:hypothetical protein Bhyg_13030 [Pseudolycoriella hygida]
MIILWKCCCLLAVAGLVTSQISEVRRIIRAETERNYVRQARFAKPSGIFGFFTTLGNIKRLFDDQYNETTNALQRVLDLVKDGFSDTATKKPKVIFSFPWTVHKTRAAIAHGANSLK